MSATILLFDIDGTLIDGRGAGRRAMEAAMAAVCGHDGGLPGLRFAGMTDRAIARAGLRAASRPDDDDDLQAVLDQYLARLPAELSATPPTTHPGVDALLGVLEGRAQLAVGLGTGNLEPGARLKLSPGRLWPRFAFGGYGSDAEDRAELLAAGIRRGAARLGEDPSACRVVVIGDTPKDVAAARAVGAQCLAVATSFFSVAELLAQGATWAVEDLRTTIVVDALCGA